MRNKEWSFSGKEVPEEVIAQVSPHSMVAFNTMLEGLDVSTREYGERLMNNEPGRIYLDQSVPKEKDLLVRIDALYNSIVSDFKKETGMVLKIEVPVGDTNNEDDQRGYWAVQNLYIVNPEIDMSAIALLEDYDVICGG